MPARIDHFTCICICVYVCMKSIFICQIVVSAKAALRVIIDQTAAAAGAASATTTAASDAKASAETTFQKRIGQMKTILYGDGENPDIDEAKAVELSRSIQQEGFMLQLLDRLDDVPFEARKDTALIYNSLIRKNIQNFAQYVLDNFETTVRRLIEGYGRPESALNCGSMLRETIRHPELTRAVLYSDLLWPFFDVYVHLPSFDIASDAFNTLRDLLVLTKNKVIAAEFLETNFDAVFQKYEVNLYML
jgi:calcium binding protein 39